MRPGVAEPAAPAQPPGEDRQTSGVIPLTAVCAAAAAALVLLDDRPLGRLLVIIAAAVLLMISSRRTAWENRLEELSGVAPREVWPPALALVVAWRLGLLGEPGASGAATERAVLEVITDKLPILLFIMAFALAARGLGDTGFFDYAALRVARKGGGDTNRLMLYLFTLTSVLTYFTSNDIVILGLTPILIKVAFHGALGNARLLLLAQFVAANTLSMGILIGSPTNLIVGSAERLNFFEFLFMMAVPTLVAFMATFVTIHALGLAAQRRSGLAARLMARYQQDAYYDTTRLNRSIPLTAQMRTWLTLFCAGVALVAVISLFDGSLYLVALPVAVGSCALVWRSSRQDDWRGRWGDVRHLLAALPVGVLVFGLCFFVLADAVARQGTFTELMSAHVTPLVTTPGSWLPFVGVFVSGLSVNLFNDLPASALLAEVLTSLDHGDGAGWAAWLGTNVLTQAVLVGVNIGCYVTPVGALAGLLWFSVMRREVRLLGPGHGLLVPSRLDLVAVGSFVFVLVGFASAMAILVVNRVVAGFMRVVDVKDKTSDPVASFTVWGDLTFVVCVLLLGMLVWRFQVSVRRSGVALGYMKDVFSVVTRARLAVFRHQQMYRVLVALLVISALAYVLKWTENTYERLSPGSEPTFSDLTSFFAWLVVFVGSGFEQEIFPNTLLGILVAGVLPLTIIGAVIRLSQLPDGRFQQRLGLRLARGEIPTSRLFVLNFGSRHAPLVRQFAREDQAFVVLVAATAQQAKADALAGSVGHDKVHVLSGRPDAARLVADYSLDTAAVIVIGRDCDDDEMDFLPVVVELERALATRDVAQVPTTALPIEGVERMTPPLVLLECETGPTDQRLQRVLLDRLASSLLLVRADDVLGRYLAADALGDVDQLTAHYRLVRGDGPADDLVSPLSLVARPAACDQVLGLVTDVGGRPSFYGKGNLATSRDGHAVHAVLVAGNGSSEAHPAPASDAELSVVVVNLPSTAVPFVRRLISGHGSAPPANVTVTSDGPLPHGLAKSLGRAPATVLSTSGPVDAAHQLTRTPALLGRGARLYVFLPTSEVVPEDWVMRFLEALDHYVHEAGVDPVELHVVVETQRTSAASMYSSLWVDKLFSSEHYWRSYFEALSLCLEQSRGERDSSAAESYDFMRSSHHLAHQLIPFVLTARGGRERVGVVQRASATARVDESEDGQPVYETLLPVGDVRLRAGADSIEIHRAGSGDGERDSGLPTYTVNVPYL